MRLKNASGENVNSLYRSILELVKLRNKGPGVSADNLQFCFMLHDERANEIQKVEVADLSEWLQDGSFEKTDKLYISFLVKEY